MQLTKENIKPGMLFKKLNSTSTFKVIKFIEGKYIKGILTTKELIHVRIKNKDGKVKYGGRIYSSSREKEIKIEEFEKEFNLTPATKEFKYKNLWERNRWENFYIMAGEKGWICEWEPSRQTFHTPEGMKAIDKADLKEKFTFKKWVDQCCENSSEVSDIRSRIDIKIWKEEFKDRKPERDLYNLIVHSNNYLTDEQAYNLFYRM